MHSHLLTARAAITKRSIAGGYDQLREMTVNLRSNIPCHFGRPLRVTKAWCVRPLLIAGLLALAATAALANPAVGRGAGAGQAVIGGLPVQDALDVAVNPSTDRVYVSSRYTGVKVFDGATNAALASISILPALRLAVNPVTNLVYVSGGSDVLTVIDGSTNAVAATIPIAYGGLGFGVAVNSVTNRIYVGTHSTVTVVDGATNTIIATLPCPGICSDIAVDPVTDHIYVADWRSVFVIDGATNTVVATIPMNATPLELDVNPVTGRVYVADYARGTLRVIDGATNSIVDTITAGVIPLGGVSVDPSLNRIYVANYSGVTVIDGASDVIVDTVTVCGRLGNTAFSEREQRLFAVNSDALSVAIVGNGSPDTTAPVVTTPSFGVNPLPVGSSTTFSATVTDDLSGAFRGEYFIGADPGLGLANRLFISGSSLSAPVGDSLLPGVYPVGVRARDQACNWSATQTGFLVVYDPSAGFATGAGSIVPGSASSDTGDLLPGLDGASKAQFAFVVKYSTGSQTVPGGNLEFQYKAGNFHLKSAAMDWLVVTNQNWAKFQGTATIDGASGTYPFHVDARDGDPTGQPDRFVLKIYAPGGDPNTASPIYKASGDLQSGQVQIHS